MAELRDTKRHRKRLSLKFGLDAVTRIGFTEDVSMTGMFIKTTAVYPPGSHIMIELTLGEHSVVRMRGIVVWAKKVPPNMLNLVKKCGMGIRLINIEAGEELFEDFCMDLHGR